MTTFVILAVLVAALLLVYSQADREVMSAEKFRIDSGYETAELSDGVTAYRDLGKKEDPIIVVIHGATLGSVAYEPYFEPLVQAGFRVIAYDEYGRGFSDRVACPLTMDLMRRQLLGLLDHLAIDRAALFGISLGGAIAARFAAAHPDRVYAIGFQVPLIRGATSWLVTVANIPLLNRFFARVLLTPRLISRGEAVGTGSPQGKKIFEHFKDQFLVRGTERNMLSMLSDDSLGDRLPDHQAIARTGIPVQFVYATDDPEIEPALVEKAVAFYTDPDVAKHTGGHFFSAGQQGQLAADLVGFLRRHA